MTNQHQPYTEVPSGIADEADDKRKLLAELRESVDANPKMKKNEKKKLLKKLNSFTAVELEKTRHDIIKDGQAQAKKQKRQEKPKG